MRVRRVAIRSFGGVRDRTLDLSDGFTVVHGPNESGKTTTMEFIRTVLVPSGKRNLYPSRQDTDSGDLVLVHEGEEAVLRLTRRKVAGERPPMPTGTDDPALFRSVFAMTPADLDDDSAVTEGGIRTRFLTVPGGESVPSVLKSSEEAWVSALGKRTTSQSRVNALDGELAEVDARIADVKALTESYGDLDARRRSLERELSSLEAESAARAEYEKAAEVRRSNEGNYRRLEELEARLAAIGGFERVSRADVETRSQLEEASKSREAAADEARQRRESLESELGGADRRKVSSMSRGIEALPGRMVTYHEDSVRVSSARTPEPEPPKRHGALLLAGVALIAVGVAAALVVTPYAAAAAAAGAVLVLLGLRRPASVPDPEADAVAEARARMASLEDDVSGMMGDLGIPSRGLEADVAVLTDLAKAASGIAAADNALMRARMDASDARARLLAFYQRFSGEEGYLRCLELTEEADSLRAEADALRGAISAAGLDPDVRSPVPQYVPDGTAARRDEVSREAGAIAERMKSILGEEGLERLMDRRASLTAQLEEALLEGAAGLLAGEIASRACDDAFSKVQPGVLETADRYLGMMTGGRYAVATDPRTGELSVSDGDTVKPIGQWSSGLRAQTLLAVKLAVAREMGGGQVPMILDDVLLPFDSARKEGACRALAAVADDMQVILFTCDAETASICRGIPGASVLDI